MRSISSFFVKLLAILKERRQQKYKAKAAACMGRALWKNEMLSKCGHRKKSESGDEEESKSLENGPTFPIAVTARGLSLR